MSTLEGTKKRNEGGWMLLQSQSNVQIFPNVCGALHGGRIELTHVQRMPYFRAEVRGKLLKDRYARGLRSVRTNLKATAVASRCTAVDLAIFFGFVSYMQLTAANGRSRAKASRSMFARILGSTLIVRYFSG